MIALVDCNNFFVSCERLFRPDLHGKAVIVLSNNDGCVISRSNEAKALGIQMAEAAYKRKDFFKQHSVTTFSSNYALYADISDRVMATLRNFSPDIEIYSIDECFLDLSGILYSHNEYAHSIRNTVMQHVGMPVGVGIASSKTLAKLASHIAKKHQRLNGVCVIETEKQRLWSLQNTAIDDVWGIGRRLSIKLKDARIYTAFDFTQTPDYWIKSKMGINGLRTKQELLGEPCIELETMHTAKQSICTSRSFGQRSDDKLLIREMVAGFASLSSEKLRKQNSLASVVTVFALGDYRNANQGIYSASLSQPLLQASDFGADIVQLSCELFTRIYRSDVLFKKAGVVLSGIVPNSMVQMQLFAPQNKSQRKELSQTIDELNKRFGRNTVKIATQGSGTSILQSNRGSVSPQYTTLWDDIVKIKC